MRNFLRGVILGGAVLLAAPLSAQEAPQEPAATISSEKDASEAGVNVAELIELRREVAAERAALAEQIEALQAQHRRLAAIENRLAAALGETNPTPSSAPTVRRAKAVTPSPRLQTGQQTARFVSVPQVQPTSNAALAAYRARGSGEAPQSDQPETAVGVAPEDEGRQPEIASLGRQGSAITQKGRLSGEVSFSYARADRNRALFRGVEVVESVLVGVFDINESRQDVVTSKFGLQYGLTSDIEIGVDVPLVSRSDTSVLTPVAGPDANGDTREIDNSANAFGIGDVELSVRKQLHAPRGFGPYIIGDLRATIPTGTGPFEVARNEFGEATEAATGSGFWSLTPGITAVLPSDPGVLFGSLSYTKNFASDVNVNIPPVQISRVDPGDSISFSGGIGLALNPRLSLNFGYAHTWGFGTETTTVSLDEAATESTQTSRDLQVGRFLFGTTYKVNRSTSVNFGLEAGLTEDATDLRAVLRIPFQL